MSTKKTPAEPVATITAEEVTESITGFDEIAIAANLKMTIVELVAPRHRYAWTRALIATYLTHTGTKPTVAWKTAMELTIVEVQSYFPETTADPDDITDESDEGKDDAVPAPSRTTKPRSASQPESARASTPA